MNPLAVSERKEQLFWFEWALVLYGSFIRVWCGHYREETEAACGKYFYQPAKRASAAAAMQVCYVFRQPTR